MSQRKSAWLRSVVPTAVLALALTACGSDDDSDGTDASANGGASGEQTEEPLAEEEPPAEEESEPAEDDAAAESDVQAVEPGAYAYGLGEASDPVAFEDSTAGVLEITAERLETGEAADLEGLLEPSEYEGMVPAHLYLSFTSVGGEDLEFVDPVSKATTVNADGSYGTPLVLIGMEIPGGCTDEESDSKDIAVGDTVQMCASVLVPEGGEPTDILWSEGGYELTWALN
ncbi:hypothetical protein ACTWP5_21745 [Streptomyces sp. 4N509B]|uniref:hypothetical protein n=1 Tax=Streptomyces sp. 4N509B TaxID=3457413 RepID=UPI003FD0D56F